VVLLGLAGCGGANRANPPAPSSTASTSVAPSSTASASTTTPAGTTTTRARGTTTTTGEVTGPALVVRHGAEDRRWIALTFDAGSDRGNTESILDLLAARHLHATFSLTGNFTRANPTLVRRIARDGHVIVNHSDTHQSFTGYSTHTSALSATERVDQLNRADAAIEAITGSSPRPWFRPPYGDIDAATPVDVARAGYAYVLLWTVDSLGWEGIAPADVVARCLNGATPGGILLLHVGSASTDAAALPRIIDGLRSRGYELVTVATPGFIR
jgi:peptidoglycan/xylan/chitin deacetylase (PgdA/CDA1 family)